MSVGHNYPTDAYGKSAFEFATPIKRPPVNKSRIGIHQTTIRDSGECGPTIECTIEYTARHVPACETLDVQLGSVISVERVRVTPVYYAERSVVMSHPSADVPLIMQHWIDTANVLLNEHVALCERIEGEIREKLLAE